MGGKKNRTKWRKLSLGEDPGAANTENASAQDTQDEADSQTDGHTPQQDVDGYDVEHYNGDYCPENILSLFNEFRNDDAPPTLVFPNLGPLPIVGFSSQPPPPAGPPVLTLPVTQDAENVVEPDGESQAAGVYVNGLWIPKSELYGQYGGRTPPCLVYHPIPWIRVRNTGSPSHGSQGGHHNPRGVLPSDAHYRLYFSRRPQPHRGSWRSTRRAQQSLSPYLWCLNPPPAPQPSSPPVFDDKVPLQQQQECETPPVDESSQVPPCQASSSYVYPGYTFGPPVFTAPVLPVQSSVASKTLRPVTTPPVIPEPDSSPSQSTTPTSPKKKKKKRRNKSRDDAMDRTSPEEPVQEAVGTEPAKDCVSPVVPEASDHIAHFVESFLQSTLCQARRQLKQLKRDRLANGYTGECLASLRKCNQLVSPNCEIVLVSPDEPQRMDDHLTVPRTPSPSQAVRSPALSPNTQPVSIIFTSESETSDGTNSVESYSNHVADTILRDMYVGPTPPHVAPNRSRLFLEGLENSYSSVNHIEQFSSQFVELVFRDVYQNLAVVAQQRNSSSGVFLGFAEELLQNIFQSAKEEFYVSQNSLHDPPVSDVDGSSPRTAANCLPVPQGDTKDVPEASMSKPKALVHFLEQGFHAPSSETFDNEALHRGDELDDYVSRERYMEGDPALSHLNLFNQSEALAADSDQDLSTLQDKMRLTNQSIYKISYDEISYTDQSEGEEPEPFRQNPAKSRSVSVERETPLRFQPLRLFENHLRTEIPVHEAETASEAGSEDIELIPHRYESGTTVPAAQEKHLYVNKLSLATELLRTNENLPYDDDFKRIIDEDRHAEEGTVNLGFVCDEAKVVTTGPKAISRVSAADSGVQSEESEDEVDLVKKLPSTGSKQRNVGSQDENNLFGKHVHERPYREKTRSFTHRTRLGFASHNYTIFNVCF